MIIRRVLILFLLFRFSATFSEKTVKFGISEDAPIGTIIGQLSTEDGFSSYRISRGNSKVLFDNQSFQFKVSSPLNRESEDVIDMLIITSPPSIIHVLIDILDVNDNSPEFASDSQRIEIFESAPSGWRIAISGASDPDDGANGTIGEYKLEEEKGENSGLFRIVQQDGLVFLELTGKLDRETIDFYSFRMIATDSGSPPRSSFCILNIVVLDTNDNSPDFGVRSITLDWNGLPDISIFHLNASDSDSGKNGEITYRLIQNSETPNFLQITNRGGGNGSFLMTKKNTIQYCSPQCEITIVATDSGTPPLSANLDVVLRVIYGNINEPNINIRFYPSDFDFIVVSPEDANGKTLAILSVSDSDGPIGKNSKIWLESGNEDNIFSLISRQSINILTLKNAENAEKELYELEFKANDDQKPMEKIGQKTLRIFFKKFIKPVHIEVAGKQIIEIENDAVPGSFVSHVTTNCSNKCTFQLIDIERVPFKIDINNGMITTSSNLPDDVSNYNLIVRVKLPQPSTEYVESEIVVKVRKTSLSSGNDNKEMRKPVHLKRAYQFSAWQDTSVGTVIGKLPNSNTYSQDGSFPVDVFPDGSIFVSRPLLKEDSIITIPVVLKNRNTTQSTEVTIVVKMRNQHDPDCGEDREFEIVENSKSGLVIGTIKGIDKDSDVISYKLLDSQNLIYIEPSTGRILSKVVFDVEKLQNFTFHYEVQDYGSPSRIHHNCSATISILDQNDNSPQFGNTQRSFSIIGDTVNELVTTILATDDDVDPSNRQIQYRILNYQDLFKIYSSTGMIRTKKPIPTTFTRLNLTIEAINIGTTNFLSSTSFILIHVGNQKSSRIELISKPIIRIHKNDEPGTRIGKIEVESDTVLKWEFEKTKNGHEISIDTQGNVILGKVGTDQGESTLVLKSKNSEKRIPFMVEIVETERNDHTSSIEIYKIQKPSNSVNIPVGKNWRIVRTVPVINYGKELIKMENGAIIGENFDNVTSMFVFLESDRNLFKTLQILAEPEITKNPNPCQSMVILFSTPSEILPNCSYSTKFQFLSNNTDEVSVSGDGSSINIQSQNSIISNLDFLTSTGSSFMLTSIRDVPSSDVKFASKNFLMLLSSVHPIGSSFGRVTAESGYRIRYYLVGNEQISIDADTGELFLRERFYQNLNEITIVAVIPTGIAKAKVTIEVIEDHLHLPTSEFALFAPPILKIGVPIGRIETGRSDVLIDIIDPHFYVRKSEVFVKKIFSTPRRFYEIEGVAKKGKLSEILNITVIFGSSNIDDDLKENELVYSIEENSEIESIVGTVPNAGKSKYRLIDQDCGIMIDQDGIIRTTRIFDREEMTILKTKMIEADVNIIWEILIFIDDVNDNPPKILDPPKKIVVQKQDEIEFAYQLLWKDSDEDANNFRFDIIDGDYDGFLKINNDGLIQKSGRGVEKGSIFNATFRIYDSYPPFEYNTDDVTIEFEVLAIEEEAPKCGNATFWIFGSIPKNGEVIGKITSSLPTSTTFRILPHSLPNAEFVIDSMNGEILVNKQSELQKNIQTEYNLEVQVIHYNAEQYSKCQVRIQLSDISQELEIIPGYVEKEFYISETSNRGTFIGSVVPHALDSVIFKIEDANFTISPFDGSIFTNAPLDFEQIQKYSINISATIIGTETIITKTFGINIIDENDEYPRFITGDTVLLNILEEQIGIPYPIIIGSSIAEDLDEGQNGQVTYSIVSGNTSLFAVNSTTGDILELSPVDREDAELHELLIEARDGGNPPNFATSKIMITVLDVNDNFPIFIQSSYSTKILENTSSGMKVLRIQAVDKDQGENSRISYYIEDQEDVLPFRIDEATGWVTVFVSPGRGIDREMKERYDIDVIASDHGNPAKSSKTKLKIEVIDENDNWPTIHNQNMDVFVPNDVVRGDLILVIDARDADKSDILTFSLNGSSEDSKYFEINQQGEILVKQPLTTKSFFQIVVVVSDGVHSTSSSFTFYLQKSTDFPKWVERVDSTKIREHEGQQIAVFRTKGVGKVQYSTVSSCRDHVAMDPTSGILSTKPSIDREEFGQCVVWIIATSEFENKPLSVITKTIIEIIDLNDNSPEFEQALYIFNITENSGPSEVGIIRAIDKDYDQNSKISYQILEGDPLHEFIIGEGGNIETIRDLDRESKAEYYLVIEASDAGEPVRRTSNTTVLIKVIDEDDNAPRFSRIFHADIPENLEIGSFVIQLSASDSDEQSNHMFSFEPTEQIPFYVEQETGKVYTNSTLDYEKKSSYRIKVRLTDGVWSIETSLFITILDINDNSPVFESSEYFFFVSKNSNSSKMLVSASDVDSGENGKVRYSISPISHEFRIDAITGEIFKVRNSHFFFSSLRVIAEDRGLPSLRAETQVLTIEEDQWKKKERKIRKGAKDGSVIGNVEKNGKAIILPKNAAEILKNGEIVLKNNEGSKIFNVLDFESSTIFQYKYENQTEVTTRKKRSEVNTHSLIIPANISIGIYFSKISIPNCPYFEPFENPDLIQIDEIGNVMLVRVPNGNSWKTNVTCNDGIWPKNSRTIEVATELGHSQTTDSIFEIPKIQKNQKEIQDSIEFSDRNITIPQGTEKGAIVFDSGRKSTVISNEWVTVENGKVVAKKAIDDNIAVEVYKRKSYTKQFKRSVVNININQDTKACPVFSQSQYFFDSPNSGISFFTDCVLHLDDSSQRVFYFNNSNSEYRLFSRKDLQPGTYQNRISMSEGISIAHVTLTVSPNDSHQDPIFPQVVFVRENYKTSPNRPLLQFRSTNPSLSTYHLADDNFRQVFDVTENGAVSNKVVLNAKLRNVYKIPINVKSPKRQKVVRVLVDDVVEKDSKVLNNLNITVVRNDDSNSKIDIDISPENKNVECQKKMEKDYEISSSCLLSTKLDSNQTISSGFINSNSTTTIDIKVDKIQNYDKIAKYAIDMEFYGKSSAISQFLEGLKKHYDDMKVIALSTFETFQDAKYRISIGLIDRNGAILESAETRRTLHSFIQRTRPSYLDFVEFKTDHCDRSKIFKEECHTTIEIDMKNGGRITSKGPTNTIIDLPRGKLVGSFPKVKNEREIIEKPKKTCEELNCGKSGICALSYEESEPYCQCGKENAFESQYSCDDELLPFSINGGGIVQFHASNYSMIKNDAEKDCDGMEKLELDFRASQDKGSQNTFTILTIDFGKQKAIVEIVSGVVHFSIADKYSRPVQIKIEKPTVNDGHWHRLRITMSPDGKKLSVQVDGRGKEVKSRIPLPLLFTSEKIQIGPSAFSCFRRLVVQNVYLHPNNKINKYFSISFTTSTSSNCPIDRRHRALSFFTNFTNSTTISLLLVLAIISIIGLFVCILIIRRKCGFSESKTNSSGWKRASEIDAYAIKKGGHINRGMMMTKTSGSTSQDDTYDVASMTTYSNLDQIKQATSTDDVEIYTTQASRRYQSALRHGPGGQINMAYL